MKDGMDYTLEHDGEPYIVAHVPAGACILECDGEHLLAVDNADLWKLGEPMPKGLAHLAINAYQIGRNDGEGHGYWRCQYDIRKVLGIK